MAVAFFVQIARGYIQALQSTIALGEETQQAAETALALQTNLAEAVLAKGYYHYSCLKDYDTAVRYFEQESAQLLCRAEAALKDKNRANLRLT